MTRRIVLLFVLGLSLLAAAAALADSAPGLALRDAVGQPSYPAAPRLAQLVPIAPAVVLDTVTRAMPEKVVEIEQWNASGHVPFRNGVRRPFVDPVRVEITGGNVAAKSGPVPLGRGVVATTARGIAWSGNVKVDGAQRLRLHLKNVDLPDDAVLWVYGGTDSTAFGKELIDGQGGLWTPSAWGDTVHLELEVPSGAAASFAIDEVLELLDGGLGATRTLKAGPTDNPSCLEDVTCVGSTPLPLSDVRRAIAHLEFVVPEGGAACTGGLMNDTKGSGTPYLLTANHCISDQTEASSLQAFFDWSFSDCLSVTIPPLSSVPKASGATLLTTKDVDTSSDFSLLRLNSLPANRWLLGWTTDRSGIGAGAKLYRVSHPAPAQFGPLPQQYSTTFVTATGPRCGLNTTNFIFSVNDIGGTYGGSSGSPVLLSNGAVVGQLFGGCAPAGHDPNDGCDAAVLNVDGALATSYASLAPYLNPTTTGPCAPSATVTCLNNSRFSVRVDWRTGDGKTGAGQAIKYTENSALFWFFGADNIEMMVKVLNACSIGSTYWVFSAATTDVEYTLYVVDTKTGAAKSYFHAGGTPAPAITDTNAFDRNSSCP